MTRTARTIIRDLRTREAQAHSTMQGTDLQLMRESNRLLVLNCVREHGAIARAEVARHTGLSRTTVGNIVDDLLREGFVREGDSQRAEPSGGRRIIPVHFNATAGYIVGVAMGRHHLTLVLSDLSANVLHQSEMPFIASQGPDIALPHLVDTVRNFITDHHIPWGKLVGVGIGLIGPVNLNLTGTADPTLLSGWDHVNVRQLLTNALQLPIYLDNNANMGALAESRYGAGRGVADMLYIKAGTGIGGAILIGSQIYRGGSGSAGEIGHITVDPHGPVCHCGNIGCLEAVAGKHAIVAAAQRDASALDEISHVIAAAQAGDHDCRAAINRAGEAVGIVLAGLINFFNPTLVVLDGSTMQAGDLFVEPIKTTIKARTLPAPLTHTNIIPAALQGKAIALGGVATVIDAVFGANPSLPFALAPARN